MSFLREAFSEEGQGSASRLMMGVHALAGICFVSFHLWKQHVMPDFLGVTTFVCAPYAINKISSTAASIAASATGAPAAVIPKP